MKIALIGASGLVGSHLLHELFDRGHEVSAIVRREGTITRRPALTIHAADAADADLLASIITGHDAVISSIQFAQFNPAPILAAVRKAGVSRYLVVGGAGTLISPSGALVMDLPDFPPAWRVEPLAALELLNRLQDEDNVNWTFVSPSAELFSGERTGAYRLGTDTLIVGPEGKSRISFQDFAAAMVDEVEAPAHSQTRFTVGY